MERCPATDGTAVTTSAGAAYLRACLSGDTEGLRVIFDHTAHVELVSDLAAIALVMAGHAFGGPVQVDLWLAAQQHADLVREAAR